MTWISVDDKQDLDALDRSNCWEDSRTVEFYAQAGHEDYFPDDVSRSGYENKNIHILVETISAQLTHLEIVLVDCDHYDSGYLENMHFKGMVDSLKRVEIIRHDGSLEMRCSRLIYRRLNLREPTGAGYFRHSQP